MVSRQKIDKVTGNVDARLGCNKFEWWIHFFSETEIFQFVSQENAKLLPLHSCTKICKKHISYAVVLGDITRVGKEALFMNCDISPREELQNKANRMTANPPRLVNPSIELQSRWLHELASTPENLQLLHKKGTMKRHFINFFTVLLNFILKIRKKHKQVW